MQLALTGEQVPSFPFVYHVVRAYKRWEESQFAQESVRLGVSASTVQRIWGLGMGTTSSTLLRDAAICVFAFCLNGVQESSLISLLTSNVEIDANTLTARLSVVKGQAASRVPLVSYSRFSDLPSPLDLWLR